MNERIINFDLLRGLAIIAVVVIHVTAPLAMDEHTLAILSNQIARFGVPVFVFLSGWGLTVSKSYEQAASYVDFLKIRLVNLLPAYFGWNIIYLLYAYFVSGDPITLGESLSGLVRGTNASHLYFVPLIVLFYLIYPVLRQVGRRSSGLLLSLLITLYSLVATWGISIEGFTRNHNLFNWIFYFILGIWTAEQGPSFKNKLNTYWVVFLLIFSSFIVIMEPLELTEEILLTQTRPSVVFYSVMVVLLLIILPTKASFLEKGLLELSKYSYQIYLSHYLFIYIGRELFPGPLPILSTVLVIFFSYGLAKIALL